LSAMNERGTDFAALLDAGALAGKRLGVARRYMGRNRHVAQVADECLEALKQAGAELVDPFDMSSLDFSGEGETLSHELKANMALYLERRGGPMRGLEDLIEFNKRNAKVELRWFGQEYFEMAVKKSGLDDAAYVGARLKVEKVRKEFTALLDREGLDAVVATTNGPAWVTDLVNGDNYGQGCSGPAAVTGFPHVTVPGGLAEGLPVGFSFFGRGGDDGEMIAMAYAFEQVTQARRRPRYWARTVPHIPGAR